MVVSVAVVDFEYKVGFFLKSDVSLCVIACRSSEDVI